MSIPRPNTTNNHSTLVEIRSSFEPVCVYVFEIVCRAQLFVSNDRLNEYLTMHAKHCLVLKISALGGAYPTWCERTFSRSSRNRFQQTPNDKTKQTSPANRAKIERLATEACLRGRVDTDCALVWADVQGLHSRPLPGRTALDDVNATNPSNNCRSLGVVDDQ
ncbi:hypothetical protein TNCV_3276821 [Trichonephila clavipes]|nr:hypothetical protein TNCV_3276821 [Trichonephila clavipes]